MKPIQGVALASLVSSLLATSGCGGNPTTAVEQSKDAVVKCAGINACAGQGACAGTLPDGGTHTCAGENACAGQGWIEVAQSECDTRGGTVLK